MTKREEQLRRLRALNEQIQSSDRGLNDEVFEAQPGRYQEVALPVDDAIGLESIALRKMRPVLAIKNDTAELVFAKQDESATWSDRLRKAKDLIDAANRSVGRINLSGHPSLDWVGTGWLIDADIIVTNRHVALEFSRRNGEDLVFQTAEMSGSCDFLQEIDNPAQREFKIARILHVEDPSGPDLAFLQLASASSPLATPIALSARPPEVNPSVVTIGYPAYDSRIPEPALMEEIFGKIYNKKRLAPGGVTLVEDVRVLHDCSTLGGNSGSVVLDLARGEAVGLHFSGAFLRTNYAVRADVVRQRLDAFKNRRPRPETVARVSTTASAITASTASANGSHAGANDNGANGNGANGNGSHGRPAPSPRPLARASRPVHHVHHSAAGHGLVHGGTASISIPLVVTISLGDTAPALPRRQPAIAPAANGESDDAEVAVEAVAEDYRDRKGFVRDFLGDDAIVELPRVVRDANDVLAFGDRETELKYEHFSVVMSASRRMCRFSACNVDGGESKKTTRATWRLDPRIPKRAQILNECYGNPPKFSRGHMTRREDPAWGPAATARRGNEDSMHVTNTTPQMQAFNSPIWLALEDYALQHARQDKMRISVITGPYLEDNDPVFYKVRCPVMFWKIIAFIHDDTGVLTATGYEMSQESTLEQEEFVFGAFTSPQLNVTTQVPIRSIEMRTGIDFGGLAAADPLSNQEATGAGERVQLERLEQIRFT